jgi:hypothetical protein
MSVALKLSEVNCHPEFTSTCYTSPGFQLIMGYSRNSNFLLPQKRAASRQARRRQQTWAREESGSNRQQQLNIVSDLEPNMVEVAYVCVCELGSVRVCLCVIVFGCTVHVRDFPWMCRFTILPFMACRPGSAHTCYQCGVIWTYVEP